MAYDSLRQIVILLGGENDSSGTLDDSWAWNGSGWSPLGVVGPRERRYPPLVYAAGRDAMFLFGGDDSFTRLADAWELTYEIAGLGDVNCDCRADAFDIEPFVIAIVDPVGYAVLYPDCDRMLADANSDGAVNAFDIDPFIELLVNP
jgi:hypothetical protein